MRGPHFPSTIRSVVAILCAACFLTMCLGSVSGAIADDTWETWPKKPIVPGVAPPPEADPNIVPGVAPAPEADPNQASKAEEAAEKKTVKARSSKTAWWVAAGTALVIGIAIAAGGGGGGGSTPNPGHQ